MHAKKCQQDTTPKENVSTNDRGGNQTTITHLTTDPKDARNISSAPQAGVVFDVVVSFYFYYVESDY
jgi:hypothetical protein